MKAQSPAHKMIQLRRKTEKIVIPKASWDLSNKENSNVSNLNDTRSKNGSSKKSSLEKNSNFKKSLVTNPSMLKCALTKMNKTSLGGKDTKQLSGQKRKPSKKSITKSDLSIPKSKDFVESMVALLSKLSHQSPIQNSKAAYMKCLSKFSPANERQRALVHALTEHILFWQEKYSSLAPTVTQAENPAPLQRQPPKKLHSEQNQQNRNNLQVNPMHSEANHSNSEVSPTHSDTEMSEESVCSYIVDPKQEIKMKPLREDLKQQLQLNFTKVDYYRKKQNQW